MKIPPPFDRIPERRRGVVVGLLFVVALMLIVAIDIVDQPVARRLAHGIVDIEMPWTSSGAEQVLRNLGDAGIAAARRSTLLDFLFLLVYPPALSLLCVMSTTPGNPRMSKIALGTAWAVLLAAPLDAFENFCMLRLLAGVTDAPWPQLGSVAAVLKFALVLVAAVMVVVCTLVRMRNVAWWIGKWLVLLRLNVFTWLSLAIGVYFFGVSQAARELWEDLFGAGQPLPIVVTLAAWACWMAALLWAPRHAHQAFLHDYRRRHGVEWPKVEDPSRHKDHVRVRRWMEAVPAVGLVLAGAAVAFGAVTRGVAEAQKVGPMLALVLIAACVNGIASELRWRELAEP
jgi:hypothetical protein